MIRATSMLGAALAGISFLAVPGQATAQAVGEQKGSLIENIVVTARKRGVAEAAQDVPIAMTALTGRAIEEANASTLEGLTLTSPNVALESNGTVRGVANFTIRGLAVNSSIASLEPTVGTFVDGVYMGTNYGVIVDMFDLESVEILRGPQGTLFGRNVTGGAVLLRTARPTQEFQAKMQASIETGPEYRVASSVGGPVIADRLRAKITASYDNDEGWFHNRFTGKSHGVNESFFVRPMAVLDLGPDAETTLIYEHGESDGDGSPFKNLTEGLPYKDLNANFDGSLHLRWDAITSETNIHVPFGNGTITNIASWRKMHLYSGGDVDGTTSTVYHVRNLLDQHQYSEELRYAGTFGAFKPTIGFFYFNQKYQALEKRDLGPPATAVPTTINGGGDIDQDSWAIFNQNDIDLSSALTLTIGLRYSYEKKAARIARLAGANCDLDTQTCDFTTLGALIDEDSWHSLSPKVSLQWQPVQNILLYGTYSQATRSGGYNLRRTSPLDPGKFDQERLTAFEIGGKSDLFDGRLRANFSLFHNNVKDIQRDVVVPAGPLGGVGIIQVIANAADVDLYGAELELQYSPDEHWLFNLNGGYTGSQYKNVRLDLNGDGIINDVDKGLELPRLAPWSYSAGMTYNQAVGDGNLRAHASYSYRDRAPLNEANNLYLQTQEMLDFDLSYGFRGERVIVSIFGKNLLNHQTGGTGAVLFRPGATTQFPNGLLFQTLDEGRVIGGKVRLAF